MDLVFRLSAGLAVAIIVATIAVANAAWDQLPALAAAAGRRLTLTRFDLLGAPLLMGVTALSLIPLALAVPRWPSLLNMPGVDLWRQLPLDARRRTFAAGRAWFGVLALNIALTAPILAWGVWQDALGRDAALVHVALIVLPLLPLVLGLTLFFPRVEEAVRAERRATGATPPASGSAGHPR
jgi:hypothetical protein